MGVINSFNLFDNMDGQASTIAAVVSAGAAALAVNAGDVWVAVTAAALCGACIGFLPHNLTTPARIFLGDGGSMPGRARSRGSGCRCGAKRGTIRAFATRRISAHRRAGTRHDPCRGFTHATRNLDPHRWP